MKTEIIKRFLDENTTIESKISGTGTLYVYYAELKIRISDHEEANTRIRESADKCFYARTADNREFDVSDILGDIFYYLEDSANFNFSKELKIKLYKIE